MRRLRGRGSGIKAIARELNIGVAWCSAWSTLSSPQVISREQALQRAVEHVTEQLRASPETTVREGWPEAVYGGPTKETVWAVSIPSSTAQVGGSRYIVINQRSGRVLADAFAGE